MCHHAKFHQNQPNDFGDTAIFNFKIAAICRFGFSDFQIFGC